MSHTLTKYLESSKFTVFPVVKRELNSGLPAAARSADTAVISMDPERIVRSLGMVAALLVLTSIAIQLTDEATGYSSVIVHKMMKLLNVDLELNIPAFFSMLILLFASVLLAMITHLKHRDKARYVKHWAALSIGFFLMAFDEAFSIHERLIEPVRSLLGQESLGILYFAWVVPAIFLIVALSLAYLNFVFSLPRYTRRLLFMAGAIYLGAAVGLEFLEGHHVEIFGKENLHYITLATVEEALEMTGVTLFIKALFICLSDMSSSVQLRIGVSDRQN